MLVAFSKYEGLGNDFIVVDARTADVALAARHAVALCDRHLGIGADGVLLIDYRERRPQMQVINADGSVPEMCGNGIRCVAWHLVRTGAQADARFEIDTDCGPHPCHVLAQGADVRVEVSMRAPNLDPKSLPVVADAPVLEQVFEAAGHSVRLTCVSMGNPHAVTFDDVREARAVLGPALEKHGRFPRAANIGFARVTGPQQIELAVWERGVGFTEACGTGACACAVAAVETQRAQRGTPIEVRLPGGPLQIVVRQPGERLLMTGPAKHVFDGSVEL
jgi:diaminopimelate epimerase